MILLYEDFFKGLFKSNKEITNKVDKFLKDFSYSEFQTYLFDISDFLEIESDIDLYLRLKWKECNTVGGIYLWLKPVGDKLYPAMKHYQDNMKDDPNYYYQQKYDVSKVFDEKKYTEAVFIVKFTTLRRNIEEDINSDDEVYQEFIDRVKEKYMFSSEKIGKNITSGMRNIIEITFQF